MKQDTGSKAPRTTAVVALVNACEQLRPELQSAMLAMIRQIGQSAERFFAAAADTQADLRA